jgi:ABC-2 type transport system permease protein
MRNITFFCKKELLEYWRTRKLLVLWIAFAAFGVMSPLFAKIMPQILKASFGESLPIQLPIPTSIDAWTQFYKNISQIGIYLLIIMFSGIVNREITKGTLTNLVTKGLNRAVVIISKYLLILMLWSLVIATSFGITLGYTAYYFPDQNSPHFFAGFLLLWLFGLFISSVVVLSSTLFRSIYSSLFGTIGIMILLYVVNLWEKAIKWNPISLMSVNVAVLQGKELWSDYIPALMTSGLVAVIFLLMAVAILKRKKL